MREQQTCVNIMREQQTCVNQWYNFNLVINRFKSIDHKDQCLFIVFDIKSFYLAGMRCL